jgi:hypothetical protein
MASCLAVEIGEAVTAEPMPISFAVGQDFYATGIFGV